MCNPISQACTPILSSVHTYIIYFTTQVCNMVASRWLMCSDKLTKLLWVCIYHTPPSPPPDWHFCPVQEIPLLHAHKLYAGVAATQFSQNDYSSHTKFFWQGNCVLYCQPHITLSHQNFLSRLLAYIQSLGQETNPLCIVQSFQSSPTRPR